MSDRPARIQLQWLRFGDPIRSLHRRLGQAARGTRHHRFWRRPQRSNVQGIQTSTSLCSDLGRPKSRAALTAKAQ